MPTVPTYPVGEVQNTPLPGVRFSSEATPAAFGAENAQSLGRAGAATEQVGDVAGQIALQRQDQVNKAQVRDALSSYETKAREKLTGDFMQRHGQNALNMVADARQFHDELRDQTMDGLPNQYQKNLFADMEPHFRTQYLTHVMYAQMRAQEAYTKQSLVTGLKTATDNFITFADDPKARGVAEATIEGNTAHLYEGADAETIQFKQQQAVSHAYEQAALAKARTQGAPAGLAFLNENAAKFTNPEMAAKLQSQFEGMRDKETADVAASFAAGKFKNLAEAQAWFDQQHFPAATKQLGMEMTKTRMTQNDQAEKQVDEKRKQDFMHSAYQNPTTPLPSTFSDGTPVPAETALKAEKMRQDLARDKTAQESRGEYGRLMLLPPDQFRKADLTASAGVLTAEQYNHLKQVQLDMKGGKNPIDEKATSKARSVMEDMSYFGPKAEKWDALSQADKDQFVTRRNDFMADVGDHLRVLPKDEQTPEKAEEIVNKLAADKVLQPGHWYNALTLGLSGNVKDQTAKQYEIDMGKASMPTPSMPQNLKGLPGINYDSTTQSFMQDLPDRRNVYDSSGTLKGYFPRQAAPPSASPAVPDQSSNTSTVPDDLLQFVKEQEGFTPKAYPDSGQTSVGYGTVARSADETLTEPEASARLNEELASHYSRVQAAIQRSGFDLNAKQVKALTSFDYNTGSGVELLEKSKSVDELKARLAKFTNIKGQPSVGLANRRKAELQLFGNES